MKSWIYDTPMKGWWNPGSEKLQAEDHETLDLWHSNERMMKSRIWETPSGGSWNPGSMTLQWKDEELSDLRNSKQRIMKSWIYDTPMKGWWTLPYIRHSKERIMNSRIWGTRSREWWTPESVILETDDEESPDLILERHKRAETLPLILKISLL